MRKYILSLIILGCFCSCSHRSSFNEKICSMYIGKELVYFPDSDLVNRQLANQSRYKLLHTMDITCTSCIYEILDNESFIHALTDRHISFEIVGYSSYKNSIFNTVLLQYPFYFDFYRKFRTRNKILDDNVVRTFLLDGKKVLFAGDMKDNMFKEQIIQYVKTENIH